MKIDDIKAIAEIVAANDLSELKFESEGVTLEIKRGCSAVVTAPVVAAAPVAAMAPAAAPAAAGEESLSAKKHLGFFRLPV